MITAPLTYITSQPQRNRGTIKPYFLLFVIFFYAPSILLVQIAPLYLHLMQHTSANVLQIESSQQVLGLSVYCCDVSLERLLYLLKATRCHCVWSILSHRASNLFQHNGACSVNMHPENKAISLSHLCFSYYILSEHTLYHYSHHTHS